MNAARIFRPRYHSLTLHQNVPGTFQRKDATSIFPQLGISSCRAEYVVAVAKFVSVIPDAVSGENAAPLLCGRSRITKI